MLVPGPGGWAPGGIHQRRPYAHSWQGGMKRAAAAWCVTTRTELQSRLPEVEPSTIRGAQIDVM